MKLLGSLLSALFVTTTVLPTHAAMKDHGAIRALLNNGSPNLSKGKCTRTEWNDIRVAVTAAVDSKRRQLLSIKSATNAPTAATSKLADAPCSDLVPSILGALDAMEPKVAADCNVILRSLRNFACYDEQGDEVPVPSCEIKSFELWNVGSNRVENANFTNGSSFCSRMSFSIRAVTDACVKRVQFDFIGAKGFSTDRTEFMAPYYSFSNKGKTISGSRFQPGTYYLTTYPDDDMSLAKTFAFNVTQCAGK